MYKLATSLIGLASCIAATAADIPLNPTANVGGASTTGAGLIRVATQGEVDAGTAVTAAVTPATLDAWSGSPTLTVSYAEITDNNFSTARTNHWAYWDGDSLESSGKLGWQPETITVNFDATMTSGEIQQTIDSQGRFIPYGTYIYFDFADGTYTLTNTLEFSGFYGGGRIWVRGNTNDTTVSTSKSVIINASSLAAHAFLFGGNGIYNILRYMEIRPNTSGAYAGLYAVSCQRTYVGQCYFNGASTAEGRGVWLSNSSANYIHDNLFSNMKYAIRTELSRLISNNNDDTGTAPAVGLFSGTAATIGKMLTQPSGSTSNEWTETGGVIR